MAKRKNYYYSDARSQSTGIMVCVCCRQPITEGRYRYYETPRSYVNCHEACCSDDPEWARLDRLREESALRYAEFQQACREFRDRWGISDLDDYITEAA